MQIFEEQTSLNIAGAPEGALFLDIETTGLSAERSHLYLFGCLYQESGCWKLKQWLLENPFEERAALREICDFVRGFKLLIHFNGAGFDLPYLNAHALARQLDPPFLSMPSLDLFRELRCCKKLFGMAGARQKDFETFLGVRRDDKYDGGKLIEVYHKYCKTGDDVLLHLLLLHNREDVLGMAALMALLPYRDLYDPDSRLISSPPRLVNSNEALQGLSGEALLRFELERTYPVTVSAHTDDIYFTIEKNSLRLLMPLKNGELKHFFYPSSDYYYLPAEDMAIHKSVAMYADPAHRVKATAETCYIKRVGTFIPILSAEYGEMYYEKAGGDRFALLTEEIISDIDLWNEVLREVFRRVRKQ